MTLSPNISDDGRLLRSLFDAAIAAALPDGKFAGRLPDRPVGRTIALGAGKGAARMASAFEAAWPHDLEGLVVTRYGHGMPLNRIELVESAHPVPDQSGLDAAARILELAQGAGPDDLVIMLMSGGASALLAMPAPGVDLVAKRDITRQMLDAGMPIGAMNAVRQSLSSIKGGRLAKAAWPARVITYVISDVPGDDPAVIGSGPTIAGATDADHALGLLDRYGISVADPIRMAIRANPTPVLEHAPEVHMLATPLDALRAAQAKAHALGLNTLILGDAIEGEAREAGVVMAGMAKSIRLNGLPAVAPLVLLSGGETTVTVRAKGSGGRNTEFLAGLMEALGEVAGISALACDTDGIDGKGDNAGAWFDDGIRGRVVTEKLSIASALEQNDTGTLFARLGSLVVSGPTLTNVNDFRAILVR